MSLWEKMCKELLSRISDEAMLLSSLSNYVKAFWYRVGELATPASSSKRRFTNNHRWKGRRDLTLTRQV